MLSKWLDETESEKEDVSGNISAIEQSPQELSQKFTLCEVRHVLSRCAMRLQEGKVERGSTDATNSDPVVEAYDMLLAKLGGRTVVSRDLGHELDGLCKFLYTLKCGTELATVLPPLFG